MERSTRRYPDMVPRAAAFAGTARTPVQNQVFVDTLVELMISDPEFRNGFYADSAHVHVGLRRPLAFSLMGLSAAFYRNELWRGPDARCAGLRWVGSWDGLGERGCEVGVGRGAPEWRGEAGRGAQGRRSSMAR
ncbi:MAG: hypothetical protein JO100_10365 [Pseudonocardia sp.]|nr:hypothetical protein [Pseudonocardia sp.]